ncbi:rhamnulokinase [Marmoricola sp. RAF53]|uniref:rhamnulokinase n=1 Tax=Marmoricola sp. RAF53 TaxID=3233059 RepID=UPI003F97D455
MSLPRNRTVQVAAVDLGASSGRVVLGEVGPGVLRTEAVARFPNDPVRLPDGLHWNLVELYHQAVLGLRSAQAKATARGQGLASIGVDSWAVDYGLLAGGRLLGLPYHYRDDRTAGGVATVHQQVAHPDLYARNGLQLLPFNTLYQLAADPLVAAAETMLLVPDLLGYWLTGASATERTNASTTGLLDVATGAWDTELAERLGLPSRLLGTLVDPGTPLGYLLPHVAEVVGADGIPVVAVGSHDTASAVVGVPLQGDDAAFLSCGTWGLVGVELEKPVLSTAARVANFTNEGGVDGRVRFLTNVMGLWLLSECLRGWDRSGHPENLESLLRAAAALPPAKHVFDVQDPSFVAPGDMPARITGWYDDAGLPAPASRPALVRAVVDSLAQAFADAVEQAAALSGRDVRTINLVGGGALNTLLCQAVADRSGRVVLAGPVEATALGNVLVQGRAAGAVSGDLEALRRLVLQSTEVVRYQPRDGRMAG